MFINNRHIITKTTKLFSSLIRSTTTITTNYNKTLFFQQRRNTMDTTTCTSEGLNLNSIVQALKSIAPTHTAESWDNVGLLVEPSNKTKLIRHMFLTNDLTEPVLNEVLEHNSKSTGDDDCIGLIVSYHPPIFNPLKRLTQSSAKERIIVKTIESEIGIYSPHTSHDSLWGGVNDWILTAFNKGTITPLGIIETNSSCPTRLTLSGFTNKTDLKVVGDYIMTINEGITESSLNISKEESINGSEMFLLNCSLSKNALNSVVPKLMENYSQYSLSIGPSLKVPQIGSGRLIKFDSPCPLDLLISQIKTHLKLDHIRVAIAPDKDKMAAISSLAVCVGSGASLLRGVKADVYLTGEMSHHDLLEANSKGIHVILCEHSNSERGFLTVYKTLIEERLPTVKVTVSQVDRDPISIV